MKLTLTPSNPYLPSFPTQTAPHAQAVNSAAIYFDVAIVVLVVAVTVVVILLVRRIDWSRFA